ncbi:MAG: hypothetical protein RRX94_06985 [Raoultibacter sp.]
MTKTKKSTKSLALVLAAVLALTPMAGFPITALATGEAAAPQTEAPAADATDAPATDAGETPQVEAPTADADTNTDAAPSTPAPAPETPQAEAPATDAGTNPGAAGSATKAPAANVVTPDLAPAPLVATPTPDPAAANDGAVDKKDFSDPIFWEYVQQNFDTNKNQTLEADEIKAVKEINVSHKNIKTLQGIEHFTNLTSLNCYATRPLTTLDVSANTALTTLTCFSNGFSTLDVSKNTALTFLSCANFGLTTLDVSKNTALTTLDCSYTNLTTLDVSKNTALTGLYCASTAINTLDLSANTALTTLDCSYGGPTTLDLSANIALTTLYCIRSARTTLDVSNNTALETLCCEGNYLTTLDLTGLDKLSEDPAHTAISPQYPQIPVVKRGETAYELDLEALAKGQTLTAITLDGAAVDLATYQKMRGTAPTSLQYTCGTGSSVAGAGTMEVTANGFDYSYPIGAKAEGNGSISWEGKPAVNEEFLVPENSTATFTIAPNTGSELASVLVDDVEVPSDQLKGNTYTFTNVTAPHTIAATFTTPTPPPPEPPTPIVNFYSVTATAENGTITSDHATLVREGSSVKCTFSPKEGYALESVSVNGKLVKATEEGTATTKTYSHTINSIYSDTTIHVVFKAVEPPVDPTDPVDPPKPPVDPVDPVDPIDPPKPPVDPVDPINPPTPPALPDNGGNGNNNGGATIVERINTVVVPVAPQATALAAAPAAKTEAAPAQVAADNAAPQGQLENPALGAQTLDTQHSHIPLALLLLAVWLVGGFAVIRQRKHTHDAIDGASY